MAYIGKVPGIESVNLNDLNNMNVGTAVDQQIIKYDSATQKWINTDLSTIVTEYTTADFDSDFGVKSTDNLVEGLNNLYYTKARVDSDVQQGITALIDGAPAALDTLNELAAALADDANFASTITNQIAALPDSAQVSAIITADVDQAFVNALNVDADTLDNQDGTYYLDYTNFTNTPNVLDSGDVRNIFSAAGDLTYNSATGEFSLDVETVYTKSNFDSDLNLALSTDAVTTTDLTEGANLYYTTARADSDAKNAISAVDAGGDGSFSYNSSTGQFTYTGPSATEVRAHFTAAGDLSYNSGTGEFSVTTYKSTDFDTDFAGKSTTDLAEGSNLYYTTDRADSDAKSAVSAGTGLSYNSTTGEFSIPASGVVSGTYGSASQVPVLSVDAQGFIDSIGTVSVAGVSSFNYDSATGQLTINTADGGTFAQTVTLDPFTTTDLTEGSNLYYTTARADSDTAAYLNTNGYDTATNIIATIVDAAPTTLDTLNELAAALGDDPNFATTVTNSIAALPDSAQVSTIISTDVDKAFVDALNVDADTLDGQDGSYYLNYANFTSTPNVLDSSDVKNIFSAAGDLAYNSTTGQFSVTTYKSTDFDTDFAGKSTTDLAEGSNLYYTTARADSDAKNAVSAGGDLNYDPATGVFSITVAEAALNDSAVRSKLSAVDAGGDGSFSYDSATGVFTYTGPSAAEARAHFSGGTGITYNSSTGEFTTTDGDIVHDNLSGFVANEHIDHSGVTITAGAGLTGGGDITASRTINVGAGTGVTVNADNIAIGQDVATTADVVFNSIETTNGLIVGGDLQVQGTTTTVNAQNLEITDNMIYMNAGESAGSPTLSIDVGWAANVNDNGSYQHVGMFRDATDDTFKVYQGYTPEPDSSFEINTGHASFDLAPFAAKTLSGKYLGADSDIDARLSGGTGITYSLGTISTNDGQIVHDNLSGFVANEHIDHSGVSITAGSGLTGGGDITASRTLNIGQGTGITVSADAISTNDAEIVHDNLSGFVANEHIDHSGVSIVAGNGLTGGGDITTSRTINVVGGGGINVNADNISIDSAEVRALFSATGDLSYNSTTGEFSANIPLGYDTTDFDSDFGAKTTTDLAEGTNLYYTTSRADSDFDARLATKSTTDVAEGTNLYYTTARADSDAKNAVSGGTGITYNSTTGSISTNDGQIVHDNLSGFVANEHIDHSTVTITAGAGLTGGGDITSSRTINIGAGTGITVNADSIEVDMTAFTTSNLAEGTNLYYTTARADSDTAAYLSTNGYDTATNIIATIVDAAPTTLDTLNELAAALGDDPNFATTVTNSIAALPDSGQVVTLINSTVDATYINALTIDADTLGGQAGSYYLDYTNFTNTPNLFDSADLTSGTLSNIVADSATFTDVNFVSPNGSHTITASITDDNVWKLTGTNGDLLTVADSAGSTRFAVYDNSANVLFQVDDDTSGTIFTVYDRLGNIAVSVDSDLNVNLNSSAGVTKLANHAIGSQTTTTTTTSQTAVATFSSTLYKGADVSVMAVDGTKTHMSKFSIIHNGTTASASEYGIIYTDSALATYAVDISGGNVRILATPATTNSTVFKSALTLMDA